MSVHTMVDLQAFQSGLQMELVVVELWKAIDLALCATKQTASAMDVKERHLWFSLIPHSIQETGAEIWLSPLTKISEARGRGSAHSGAVHIWGLMKHICRNFRSGYLES